MSNKDTNSLFNLFNKGFGEFYNEYYLPIRKKTEVVSLHNWQEPAAENKLSDDMYKIYYSVFFRDIICWCEILGICKKDTIKPNNSHFTESEVLSFFEDVITNKHEVIVEKIIYLYFADCIQFAIRFINPFSTIFDTQNDLIKSFIDIIKEKNNEVLQRMESYNIELLIKNIRLKKIKIHEIDKDTLLLISKYAVQELKMAKRKINQTAYADKMSEYFKEKRNSIINEIKERFKTSSVTEWLETLI